MNYSFFYRSEIQNYSNTNYDLFFSAFNLSNRLNVAFNQVNSANKYWIIYPEYNFSSDELPQAGSIISISGSTDDRIIELAQFNELAEKLNLNSFKDSDICIDITGFMRPQVLIMINYFNEHKFKSVDFIYTEPLQYADKEETKFTIGSISETRSVNGFGKSVSATDGRDLLIIGSGYDSTLISRVIQHYENADVLHLFGFPSLRPDMYQENLLRTFTAADEYSKQEEREPLFAPASDPFVTAQVVFDHIEENKLLEKYRHIYLSPLSTKAQTLGFGLVYCFDLYSHPVSIIFPFTSFYDKETSTGVGKMWIYSVEFS